MREGERERECAGEEEEEGRQGQAGGEGETAVDLIKENGKMEGRGKGDRKRRHYWWCCRESSSVSIYLSIYLKD